MKTIWLILTLAALTNCTTASKSKYSQKPNEISVMAYNVENLFDIKHDKNKNDYTYLPKALKSKPAHIKECNKMTVPRYKRSCLEKDWSQSVLDEKMKRIAHAILQVNNGRGPDFLIVEEVENIHVLKQLNQKYLKAASYKEVILLEGPDKRGIDIGFLSRLERSGKPRLHIIPFKGKNENDQEWMEKSRGILEATFHLPNGKKLTAFGVHFPSPRNPSYWRAQAIDHLNHLQSTVPKGHVVIAGGDFNVSRKDDNQNRLYKKRLSKKWLISHQLGCKDCQGTEYYHRYRQWSFLDALIFNKDLDPNKESGWAVDPTSVGIPNDSIYQTSRFFSPARFSATSPVGVSDHWPIYARLVLKEKPNK